MSDIETRFHETWLGMVQPIEGLVVSVPVLVDAQCMARQSPAAQRTLRELTLAVERKDASGARTRKKADEERRVREEAERKARGRRSRPGGRRRRRGAPARWCR